MKRNTSFALSLLSVVCLSGVTTQAQDDLRQQYLRQAAGGLQAVRLTTPAWWTNTALMERLGLTDDQKAKIQRAFENHNPNITAAVGLLEKEEMQLQKLLEAETIDRNAILTQIDRVIQARGEVERANSAMTLEMREQLTRAQWMQLPQNAGGVGIRGGGGRGAGPAPTPAQPGVGGRRGGRGQQ